MRVCFKHWLILSWLCWLAYVKKIWLLTFTEVVAFTELWFQDYLHIVTLLWGISQNSYQLLNLRALKIPTLYTIRIFQCMGKISCVEFQREPLKFHTKYLTRSLKYVDYIHRWKFKSFYIQELVSVFEMLPCRHNVPDLPLCWNWNILGELGQYCGY